MARLRSDLYVSVNLINVVVITDNLTDDVPRPYIRPPTSGWQGSSAVPCQNQGVYTRPPKNVACLKSEGAEITNTAYTDCHSLGESQSTPDLYIGLQAMLLWSKASMCSSRAGVNEDIRLQRLREPFSKHFYHFLALFNFPSLLLWLLGGLCLLIPDQENQKLDFRAASRLLL